MRQRLEFVRAAFVQRLQQGGLGAGFVGQQALQQAAQAAELLSRTDVGGGQNMLASVLGQ